MLVLDTVWTRRKKVAEERLEICKSCPHYYARISKCNQCGCIVDYKAMIMSSKCPLDKWKEHGDE